MKEMTSLNFITIGIIIENNKSYDVFSTAGKWPLDIETQKDTNY